MGTGLNSAGWKAVRQEVESRSSVSRTELALLVNRHLGVGADYAIRRLCREGILERAKLPRRGLYLVTSSATNSSRVLRNPALAIQTQYGADILFCYGSALYLHGLSRYANLTDYYVAARKEKKQNRIGSFRVSFVKTALDASEGTTEVDILDQCIRVTDIERTLIDCIHRPKYAQGWENLIHAMNRAGRIDQGRLCGYLKRYRLPSLVAKTCAVLDEFSAVLGIDVDQLVRMRPYLPKSPIRFSRNEPGILNKRWNVYMPQYLINKEEGR